MHIRHSRATSRAALFVAVVVVAAPRTLPGQDPARLSRRDSVRADSIAHLKTVTIAAAPAERAQPVNATHVDAAAIRLTPSSSPYDLLRQTAGVESHLQGQGPGFASDASLRGFSSDHSTDLALWVDGVPINEPVNGHAEGYNDWAVLFPGGIQDIDVIHGPTSALFGNFALGGVVNVRTLERMRGTEVTASGGSFGRADAMVLTGFDHGSDGGGVLGARYQREDGFRPNARYDVGQGHARIVRDLRPGVTIDGGAELYGGNWNSPGFLSEDEFAAHDYNIVSNPTDGGYKRRAQERFELACAHRQHGVAHDRLRDRRALATLPHDSAGGRPFRGLRKPNGGRGFTSRTRCDERDDLGSAGRGDHGRRRDAMGPIAL
jgi:outer membrane receptor protein involved in Fe transport